jgi:mRNA-degrading endonuclease toxin of MazEF toxin-antitoxin module
MKGGDIWLVGFDPAEGHEQKDRRPVRTSPTIRTAPVFE